MRYHSVSLDGIGITIDNSVKIERKEMKTNEKMVVGVVRDCFIFIGCKPDFYKYSHGYGTLEKDFCDTSVSSTVSGISVHTILEEEHGSEA